MKEHGVVRIGVIYPEDGVLDDEFWRAVPAGVTVHVTRARSNLTLHLGATYEEGHDRIAEGPYIDDAARTFTLIKPAAVAYACTSVSFARGPRVRPDDLPTDPGGGREPGHDHGDGDGRRAPGPRASSASRSRRPTSTRCAPGSGGSWRRAGSASRASRTSVCAAWPSPR